MRKTKIVATLGPATNDDVIRRMVMAGMDVARMNMSHQDAAIHRSRADTVNAVQRELARPVALLVDTKGPEIRLGKLKDDAVLLVPGKAFRLSAHPVLGDDQHASVDFPAFVREVPAGARVLIDDGRLELQAVRAEEDTLLCEVAVGGTLQSGKSVQVPGVSFSLPFLSDRDRADLKLAVEVRADFVAASFTRSAVDLDSIRQELKKYGGDAIRLIAKIENAEGVNHLDEILRVADGVMIARGDMGVEFPMEDLPAIQKEIIRKSYSAGVSVITATQMLESMITAPHPTRAEVCDVAGAIYDGTSAVMLSGETAVGMFPTEAVTTMARIAIKTEQAIDYKARFGNGIPLHSDSITEAIAAAAVDAAHRLDAAAIITLSRTGRAARMLAKYRPACPIICVTPDKRVYRQEMLTWGVVPLPAGAPTADPYQAALQTAKEAGWMPAGRPVITVVGSPFDAVRVVVG